MGRDESPCCNWRPGNGENALGAVRAVSAWAAGNATRTRRGHIVRCPVLQVQRRPARQPIFFCRTLPFYLSNSSTGAGYSTSTSLIFRACVVKLEMRACSQQAQQRKTYIMVLIDTGTQMH